MLIVFLFYIQNAVFEGRGDYTSETQHTAAYEEDTCHYTSP